MARRKNENEDQPQENFENADDTFGLPEIEYEPLRRESPKETIKEEPVEPVLETPIAEEETEALPEAEDEEPAAEENAEDTQFYQPTSYQDDSPAIWPKVLGIMLIVLMAGAAVWYFAIQRPKNLAAEAKQRELLAIQEQTKRKDAERLAEERRLAEEKQKAETVVAEVKPAVGTIETLSGRSGRYYVVIASSIDGDLIMDYAKKLSAKGATLKIIPPFGKTKFHRLAVSDADTYANAQAAADGMKGGEYGNNVWVVKY
jgi:cytoskeletal protein RodZ